MNNIIWTTNGTGSLANGEMGYDASTRIEQKRAHEWLDASEQELFFNKKRAIESVNATQGDAILKDTLGCDSSSPQSGGHIGDRLFSPKPVRFVNASANNTPLLVSPDMIVQKKGFEEQFGNNSTICSSMSQAMEDPSYLNPELRKVKVNEVRTLESCLPEFMGNYCDGEKNKVMSGTAQMTVHDMFPGSTYNTAAASTVSMAPAFCMIDKDYISIGPESSKKSGNVMLANQFYDGMSNNMLTMSSYLNRGNYNTNTIAYPSRKETGSIMAVGPTYTKDPENFFAMDSFYKKMNDNFMAVGSTYSKVPTDIMPTTSIQGQQDAPAVPLGTLHDSENSSILSMGQNLKKGEQTTISFGGFPDNLEGSDPSGRFISYGDFLNQSSAQSSGSLGLKDAVQQLNENVITAVTSIADGTNKNKEHKGNKKATSNNFPSNVKSLLSTGILDGVPVKYVSWSREKNLRGVVKGTGYLCSCEDCKLSKAINAYEFEKHAGCKTKHPNNHIYFENGKTIYAVVQELKSTPQDLLFDVIQNVTGSPINQKNFQVWKESFQAATRELRRIYGSGREEVIMPSS